MKKRIMIVLGIVLMAMPNMAQENVTEQNDSTDMGMGAPQDGRPGFPGKRPKRQQLTYEQMTAMMVDSLQLDEKQQKKVAKLNKKYKTLIEGDEEGTPFGGQRPPMGGPSNGSGPSNMGSGGPGGGMGGPSGGIGGPGGGGFGGMSGGGPRGGMGGGPRGGMRGGPGSQSSGYDYDQKQEKYDKAIRKILTEDQYDGYLKLRPQFASQQRIQDFLMGRLPGI